jgi:transketolase
VVDIDGHDIEALRRALAPDDNASRPRCVLARTVKGKGVSFMEGKVVWHYRPPSADDVAQARLELLGEGA